jgi:hypothetical protein
MCEASKGNDMHSRKNDQQDNTPPSGFVVYAGKRLVVSVLVVLGVIWLLSTVLDRLDLGQSKYDIEPEIGQFEPPELTRQMVQSQNPGGHRMGERQTADSLTTDGSADSHTERSTAPAPHPNDAAGPAHGENGTAKPGSAASLHASMARHDDPQKGTSPSDKAGSSQSPAAIHESSEPVPDAATQADKAHRDTQDSEHPPETTGTKQAQTPADEEMAEHGVQFSEPQKRAAPHGPSEETAHAEQPKGAAFVMAVMQPLDHELNHRLWGWRPNDIINITDNVNTSQRGILEVTRRTVVQLTQRISRTGSTDAFNPHLEKAMNWLMVKADRYWFPAPESKYKESLKELTIYKEMLISGKASFFIRTDNLIPLLTEYEDLLGSCDENLVKTKEDDGSAVSFFKADDYFYYARGVASAMAVILQAVHHDFSTTLDSRNGSDLLHHAIVSCKIAAQLSPLIIMNSDLDGLFANHRANMAAPISHARFYISQLIKTLST